MIRRGRGSWRALGLVAVALLLVALVTACTSDADDDGDAGSSDPPASTDDGDDVNDESTSPAPPRRWSEPLRPGSFYGLVPAPVQVQPGSGTFPLRPETVIVGPVGRSPESRDAASLLRQRLAAATGLDLPVVADAAGRPAITFTTASDTTTTSSGADTSAGGYHVEISPTGVAVEAYDHEGFVWAVQTLLQLLPPAAIGPDPVEGTFALPVGTIRDGPRYPWRGAMLDVARHFFTVDDVKAYVDELSTYKLNRLHLHLSDDQGWRLQIRAYPELTSVGSTNEVGGGPGGFYTQAEYRDLVEYARRRGVTVVPEIDTPGHTNAALRSVPELTCDGVAPEPYTGTQVGFSSLCTTQEFTYEWFDTVIGELAELTPGDWIHLGGDESDATPDDEYQRYVTRAAEIVRAHGKTPVGWEEIGQADLSGGETVVQHWREAEPTVAAAEQGARVVLSPAPKVYLDMKHTADGPGNRWAGVVSTETAYGWDPATQVPGLGDGALGVEAPLWTELIEDRETIQQRTLPRLPAVAEVAWSRQEDRAWDAFTARVATHAARWDLLGWAWTRDPGITWPG